MAKTNRTAPTWRGVNSRCLRATKYDKESSTLDVEFRKSGARYRYSDVSARRASALVNAGSIGGYFVRNVRDNYDYERLRGAVKSRSRKGKR